MKPQVFALWAALCAAMLAASCAPAPGGDGPLRMGEVAEPPGLNPLVFDNATVFYLGPLVHGYLLDADGEGRLIPALATAVPSIANGGVSRDGRTVTYHLRRGVHWHDGAPFDARDVLFSFAAVRNPNNAVADRTGFDHVASVSAIDPYTVQVRLTQPFSPFVPSVFTMGANDPYPILPAHLLARKASLNNDPYNAAPVGLGPYKLVSWQHGAKLTFEADAHFWRGPPAIKRIDLESVPSANTLQTLFQGHQIDVLVARTTGGRVFYDAIRSVAQTHTVLKPHYEFDFVILNQAHPPLDDVRVRRALAYGIDHVRIMRELNGELFVPGDSDRLAGQFAYDPAIRQPPYDPGRAAALLDAAGWHLDGGVRKKNGRPLTLDLVSTTESPTTGRFDLLAQQQLAKLGIRASEKSYGYNVVWASAAQHGINQTGRFDVEYSGWQPNAVADHSYLFRCDTRPPAGDNLARICDPVIEAAARRELQAIDPAEEASGDRAISRRLVEQSDLIFLGFNREAVAYRDGITGIVPSVLGEHLWNVYAWKRTP